MFSNHLKIGWRRIIRQPVYTAINIMGLTLGTCACIIIYLVAAHELSFDDFHPGKERIYRVMCDVTESTGNKSHFAKTPLALSVEGHSQLSGYEHMAAIVPWNVEIKVPDDHQAPMHFESKSAGHQFVTTAITQPAYFTIFPYEWLAGNAAVALKAPFYRSTHRRPGASIFRFPGI